MQNSPAPNRFISPYNNTHLCNAILAVWQWIKIELLHPILFIWFPTLSQICSEYSSEICWKASTTIFGIWSLKTKLRSQRGLPRGDLVSLCHSFRSLSVIRDKCQCRRKNKEELEVNCPSHKLLHFFCQFLSFCEKIVACFWSHVACHFYPSKASSIMIWPQFGLGVKKQEPLEPE